ncbi:MAG: hypothetical protein ABFD12_13200 [Syntrophorhabdus sp.]
MSVRDMAGNPGIWEQLSWADLSGEEKELWTALGWNENRWDSNKAPASTDKVWKDLSYQEQSAAMTLGFSEDVWDNFEDE